MPHLQCTLPRPSRPKGWRVVGHVAALLGRVPGGDRKTLGALVVLTLAQLAKARTRLESRPAGFDGVKMMVGARPLFAEALQRLDIAEYPGLAMDILDLRAQRDLELGRRLPPDRWRAHFIEAVKTMRLVQSIQQGKPALAGEMPPSPAPRRPNADCSAPSGLGRDAPPGSGTCVPRPHRRRLGGRQLSDTAADPDAPVIAFLPALAPNCVSSPATGSRP